MGKYRVVAPLGQGRVGLVYRAEDTESGRKVALKLVPASHFPTPEAKQQFLADAQAAAALSHPHIRQLYEAGESADQLFLAMEYLEGSTLKTLLSGGPVEPEAVLGWGAEIADALAAAHAAGIAQGELTPGKVFITEQSAAKLIDTGLWRLEVPSGHDLTQPDAGLGSAFEPVVVAALAPEQLRGAEPDAAGDLFMLGVVLYQMAAGGHPFLDADAAQTLHWVLGRAPEPPNKVNPRMPEALDAVVGRLLEKDRRLRLQSASEAAAALRAVAAGEPLPASVTERPEVPVEVPAGTEEAPAPKPNLAYWVVGVGIVLAGLLWFLYRTFAQP